jgi:hypothetical protein
VGFVSGAGGYIARRTGCADLGEWRRLGAVGPNEDACGFPHPSHKLRANDDELRIGEVREQPENPHKH